MRGRSLQATDHAGPDLAEFEKKAHWYKEKFSIKVLPEVERVVGKRIQDCRVLCVGCDRGEDVAVLNAMGCTQSYGVDPFGNTDDVRIYWSHYLFNYLNADGRCLPFQDSSFDVVIAIEVIEHVGQDKAMKERLDEKRKMAREVVRIVRPGGCIFLSSPNKRFPIDIAHAGMDMRITGGLTAAGMRLHAINENFLMSMAEARKMFILELGCQEINFLSPLDYINWEFECFTRVPMLKYVILPLGRIYSQVLERSQLLRESALNPHIIISIKR